MDYEALLPTAEDNTGPSWARSDWPFPANDDLTRALDAGDILISAPAKAAAKAAAAGASPDAIARAARAGCITS